MEIFFLICVNVTANHFDIAGTVGTISALSRVESNHFPKNFAPTLKGAKQARPYSSETVKMVFCSFCFVFFLLLQGVLPLIFERVLLRTRIRVSVWRS